MSKPKRYPFGELAVGEERLVPFKEGENAESLSARAKASAFGHYPKRFSFTAAPGGIMVTREADAVEKTPRIKNEDAKTRNVTVDADVQEAINAAQDRLEARLGFRPSISQTLRLLFKKVDMSTMQL